MKSTSVSRIAFNFDLGQGLGNQLWLYSSCRSIANYYRSELHIGDYRYFKGHGFIQLDADFFQDSTITTSNSSFSRFVEYRFLSPFGRYDLYHFDDRILGLTCDTLIEGAMQNINYLNLSLTDPRSHIHVNLPGFFRQEVQSYDLIVHIRGGDFIGNQSDLHSSYYQKIIQKVRPSSIGVVTDDPSYATYRLPGAEILTNTIDNQLLIAKHHSRLSPLADFARLYYAPNACIGYSSFAYWAVAMGKVSSIYAPFLDLHSHSDVVVSSSDIFVFDKLHNPTLNLSQSQLRIIQINSALPAPVGFFMFESFTAHLIHVLRILYRKLLLFYLSHSRSR